MKRKYDLIWAGIVFFLLIATMYVGMNIAQASGKKRPDVDVDVTAKAWQDQDQHQGQEQGQQQDQYQTSEQYNDQSNSQSIQFSSPKDLEIKRTVNPYSPSIDPSHPCALTWSAGLGLTGVGVSGGKAFIDSECNARETARLFFQFGEREKAIMILCAQPSAQILPGCKPFQDYNNEMRLLTLGHDKLVEENRTLREQQEIYRNQYEETVQRCNEAVEQACSK